MNERSLAELIAVAEPAWPQVEVLIGSSSHSCELVATNVERRISALTDLQVTVGSFLGAVVWICGAALIDHRWVRLLGSGVGEMPPAHREQLQNVPGLASFDAVVVAYDVLGGVFAVHGHGLDAAPGEICYWAPDTLDWAPLGFGHSALVAFLLSDRLEAFYADLRWPGWELDCDQLAADEGIAAYPFPSMQEGRGGTGVSRRAAPIIEVVASGFELATQLSSLPTGSAFQVQVASIGD